MTARRTNGADSTHAADEAAAGDRGRGADRPAEIPRHGWRDILLRVFRRISADNVTLVSAGIAFNAMFAMFPALILLISIYGMFASAADVASQVRPFFAILPGDSAKLLQYQLQNLAGRANTTLTIGAAISLAVTLWSSTQGVSALTSAMNIAYHETEKRGFIKLSGIAIAFTLGGLVGFLVLLGLAIAVPYVLATLPLGPIGKDIALALRWVLLWGFAAFALAIVYRYAPSRENPRWNWVTWGSIAAATLWLVGSVLFGLYTQNSGSYGKTYGALGGVMLLLMWFYLGSFAVLLGAELNAEMEHQTAVDTTTGPSQPMGERGAYVADTLGDASGGGRRDKSRHQRRRGSS
ncbi:MAG TPA: YihY/virulence factor BrkB family protein [Steroidobacteraceae bacterium]|jgi:membrane protein|nr:YihY/virulence factor BrkB family protein [Steroidobacteraceae bacterium]